MHVFTEAPVVQRQLGTRKKENKVEAVNQATLSLPHLPGSSEDSKIHHPNQPSGALWHV
jgi:hypothetical protein